MFCGKCGTKVVDIPKKNTAGSMNITNNLMSGTLASNIKNKRKPPLFLEMLLRLLKEHPIGIFVLTLMLLFLVIGPTLNPDIKDLGEEKGGLFETKRARYDFLPFAKEVKKEKENVLKWGFINDKGEVVIDLIYDDVKYFSEGLAAVKENGKWGFINKEGKVVIDFIYTDAEPFKHGVARVSQGSEWGYIFPTGDYALSLNRWLEDNKSANGLRGTLKEIEGWNRSVVTYRWIDSVQNEDDLIIHYGSIKQSTDILRKVEDYRNPNKYGFYHEDYETVQIPFIYDDAYSFNHSSITAVKKDDKWGVINRNGEEIKPFIYDDARAVNESYLALKQGDRWGFISSEGEVKVPFEYKEVSDFHDLVAVVTVEEKDKQGLVKTYVNKEGRHLSDKYYKKAYDFSHELGVVAEEEKNFFNKGRIKYGVIDGYGKEVVSPDYDFIFPFSEGKALVIRKDKKEKLHFAYINKAGEVILYLPEDEKFWKEISKK